MRSSRGKQKQVYTADVGIRNFYGYYSNKHFREFLEGRKNGVIDKGSKFYIPITLYSRIINDFNLEVRNLILNESFDFNMPARMGILCIRKRKLTPYINKKGEYKNPLPVDWKATYQLWEEDPEAEEMKKLVRHRNKHSNGFIAEWTLQRKSATFKNKSAYDFKAARTSKQMLAAIMLEFENNNIDYQLK